REPCPSYPHVHARPDADHAQRGPRGRRPPPRRTAGRPPPPRPRQAAGRARRVRRPPRGERRRDPVEPGAGRRGDGGAADRRDGGSGAGRQRVRAASPRGDARRAVPEPTRQPLGERGAGRPGADLVHGLPRDAHAPPRPPRHRGRPGRLPQLHRPARRRVGASLRAPDGRLLPLPPRHPVPRRPPRLARRAPRHRDGVRAPRHGLRAPVCARPVRRPRRRLARPPRPRVADGAGARLRAARHHRRARPVPRQPLHRGAPGRGVLPAERELPPGAPPLPGGSELPPPGAPPGHLGPPAARRVGHVVPRLPGPLPPRHADAGRDAHRPRRACEDPGVTPRLTHAVWAAASLPEARAFRRALGDVEGSQRRLLARIVRAGARTAYGEAHGFGAIRTAEAFRRRVPLVEYDAPGSNPGRALAPFVDRIAAGERRVLTAEPVRLLEPTSGSTAATKLIPYTAALQRDLRRAIAPWMADLYTR